MKDFNQLLMDTLNGDAAPEVKFWLGFYRTNNGSIESKVYCDVDFIEKGETLKGEGYNPHAALFDALDLYGKE